MKVLYVSKAFEGNLGATMHYKAIKEIVSDENVFTIDLRPNEPFQNDKYIAYGKYSSSLERIHRWSQGNMMFISNKIIKDIIGLIEKEKIDIVFIEDSVFGNLVKKIKRRLPNVKVISFYHDVKGVLFPQWKKQKKFFERIELDIGIRQEKINSKYCDVNIVFNERDAINFQKIYIERPESIIPLSSEVPYLDHNYLSRISATGEKKELLFVGNTYYPNVLGLKWFYKNVLPSLNDSIEVKIVGRGLENLRDEFKNPRVNVVGTVDELDDYYENADIVIIPLFDGGGMKTKTLEAISYGKIIVGTQESMHGFWEKMNDRIKGETVFMSDEPEEWIKIINNLSKKSIEKYNKEEFDLFVNNYSYDVMKKQMESIIRVD